MSATKKPTRGAIRAARGGDDAVRAGPAATAPRATRFQWGGDEHVVLSYPQSELESPDSLTTSEQAIFYALLAGQSNRQIAAGRGRAVRTVANQVAAIFAKLGVGSRAELCAKYAGSL